MPTVPLADHLKPEHFVWDLTAADKPALLGNLARIAASRLGGVEQDIVLDRLEQREAVQSTGVGQGLALPHAMVPGLGAPAILVGRVDPPVDYEALDGAPVDLVIVLLSPPDGLKSHLRLLARLARIVGQEQVLQKLRAASGPEVAHRILLDEDARHVY